MDSLTFLGTGGGRFVNLAQMRFSGGVWLNLDGVYCIVDPGPGALVRALQFRRDPGVLDCVISSHRHLDHYNDVEVMCEAMTHGFNYDKGLLVLQKDVVEYVSDYHRGKVQVLVAEAGDRFKVKGLDVEVIPTFNHAGGLGFRFKSRSGDVTYSGDTGYDQKVIKHYGGSKVLILNTIFPSGRRSNTHLNADDALKIADQARPDHLIITHFGVRMLEKGPEREAKRIQSETGVKSTAAVDGLVIDLR